MPRLIVWDNGGKASAARCTSDSWWNGVVTRRADAADPRSPDAVKYAPLRSENTARLGLLPPDTP